jgi:phenylalanyl-tRNA synthetase alpha chain
MKTFKDKIEHLQKEFNQALTAVTSLDELEQFRITFLSRNGLIASLMPELKNLPLHDKQELGPVINNFKQYAHEAFETKKTNLQAIKLQAQLGKEQYFDVTAYLPKTHRGSLHPLTHVYKQIIDIFISMGYGILEGPEVETEYYNFEALNIPKNHPARDMWDTFWLDIPGLLLRTHTSSVQVHAMETKELPFAYIAPGRVYRHEATDATHDFLFNQVEGIVIDKNISLSHLLGTLKIFFRTLFKRKDLELRVRPSYFPFVEPGIEIDISCPFCTTGCSICKKTRLIEMGGAGLVHPNVLECVKIDAKKYSGFAFGLGVDRIAMLLYAINDIRLFSSGKIEFLKQFE